MSEDDRQVVRKMNASMVHRGPDGEGYYSDDHSMLAMRRLSIIDLEHGWQPLYSEDRQIVLIANGEIYNYVELQAELRARGHILKTGSDCETIVHLYEDHGVDCLRFLRGMFSLALVDRKLNRILLARDRMGEKPLYIYQKEDCLLFASEMKAILSSKLIPFVLDPVAVNLFFHYQYVPEPMTAVKGVRKLDAASAMTIDLSNWSIHEWQYWHIEDAKPLHGDPAGLIRDSLEEVSRLVIRSDVPVGIALSGGLDSSIIAALSAKYYPGQMQSFCVGYPGRPGNDERGDAKKLADHLGMPFHDVELATKDMVEFFPQLNYWRDDPVADISGYGYHAVMKLAREHSVPVMLQGQGGDELFWGYDWVRQAVGETERKNRMLKYGWLALPSCLDLDKPAGFAPWQLRLWIESWFGLKDAWKRCRYSYGQPENQMVFCDITPDYASAKETFGEFCGPALKDIMHAQTAAALFTFSRPWPPPDQMITRLICDTYLRGNGIVQGDRLAMASSVEMRLPLLDYRLVETVVGLRKNNRDWRLSPKTWLRSAVKDMLPNWVLDRPKRGFAPPLREWHEALFKAYGNMLEDGYLVKNGVLCPEGAKELTKGPFPSGNICPLSFKALVLEMWYRQMKDKHV